jgi:hypothetical protein
VSLIKNRLTPPAFAAVPAGMDAADQVAQLRRIFPKVDLSLPFYPAPTDWTGFTRVELPEPAADGHRYAAMVDQEWHQMYVLRLDTTPQVYAGPYEWASGELPHEDCSEMPGDCNAVPDPDLSLLE